MTTRQTGYQQAIKAVAKDVKTDMNAAREGARMRAAAPASAPSSVNVKPLEWVGPDLEGDFTRKNPRDRTD